MAKVPLFYRDEPLFGFDIGYNSIKLMQIDRTSKSDRVVGYGFTTFEPKAIKNGVVVDPELVAKEVYDLITRHIVGSIDTRRVAAAVPVSKTFNRILTLPQMDRNDLDEAVRLEAEQYIPVGLDELYINYELTDSLKKDSMEVLVVAVPKSIVDSYMALFELLGLEVAMLETSISSSTRLVMHAEQTDLPTLIIDFGSISTDLSIFDTTLRVTGTIDEGGDGMTKSIAKDLNVTARQAQTIKSKHGLSVGKRQSQIRRSLEPSLDKMVGEVKRMVRFYQDRSDEKRKLEQVIILGGGANMPGLSDYLTDKIRIPTRTADPWINLDFGNLQPPHQMEKTVYATAAGLGLIKPKEISR